MRTIQKWTKKEECFLRKNYIDLPSKEIAKLMTRSKKSVRRKAERMKLTVNYTKRMRYKLLKCKPIVFKDEPINYFIAGFIAGEGSFFLKGKNQLPGFAVQLAIDDKEMINIIKKKIGVGSIYKFKKRNNRWKDGIHYKVSNQIHLYKYIIPFMNRFLIFSRKKRQYQIWKKRFMERWGIVG